MALREFTDTYGRPWMVWEVRPTGHLRTPAGNGTHDEPGGPTIGTRYPEGWLAFECEIERRRLAPIPAGWEVADDAALEALCAEAEAIPQRTRLIE